MAKKTRETKKTKQRQPVQRKGGLVLLVLVLLICVVGVEVVRVWAQIGDAEVQESSLSAQVAEKQEANAALRDDLSHANDEDFIKELARDQLGLVDPGERIFYDVNH